MVRQPVPPLSLQLSSSVTVDYAVTTATSATEPNLDLFAIFVDSLAIATEWLQLATTTYIDAVRLDTNDPGFIFAPVRSSVVWDAYSSRLLLQYNQSDELLPIISVSAPVA